jgi:polysaccharide export outer membrane protein
MSSLRRLVLSVVAVLMADVLAAAGMVAVQEPAPAPPAAGKPSPAPVAPPGVAVPADYVIGPDDVLAVVYWRDQDMSGEATVRPDGKITLPLVQDVQAAGLTPDQLRDRVQAAAKKFISDPSVTIVVRAIHSRKVFITGMVTRPGPYPINAPTTVLQLIATAGGLLEYAKAKDILIVRPQGGKPLPFNYKDVVQGKNLTQNILLAPGDTVVVP